jgi:hypothetical protein
MTAQRSFIHRQIVQSCHDKWKWKLIFWALVATFAVLVIDRKMTFSVGKKKKLLQKKKETGLKKN